MDNLAWIIPGLFLGGMAILLVRRRNRMATPTATQLPQNPLPDTPWPPDPKPEPPPETKPEPPPEPKPETSLVWPNAPTSWPTGTEERWGELLPVNPDNNRAVPMARGWRMQWNAKGLVRLVQDPSAPWFTQNAVRFEYPLGYPDGEAPGTPVYVFRASKHQVYVAAWVKFSGDWEGHQGSGVNKIFYPVFSAEGGRAYLFLYGEERGPFHLRFCPEFGNLTTDPERAKLVKADPFVSDKYGHDAWITQRHLISNVNPTPYPLGRWNLVEVIVDAVPGALSNTLWFLNGKLQGRYWGVAYPAGGFIEHHLAPVWGGANRNAQGERTPDRKTQLDHVWIGPMLFKSQ